MAETPEAVRILERALEIGAFDSTVAAAVDRLREAGGLGSVTAVLQAVDTDNHAAVEIWRHLASPRVIEEELQRPGADTATLRPLVERLQGDAVPALLDALAASESRSVRRGVMDLLSELGALIVGPIGERLVDEGRWYVERNMLSLLAEIGHCPADIDCGRYLHHPDSRVRREAYRLFLHVPGEHERALGAALSDPDPRNLRQGLAAARERMPASVVPLVVQRLNDESLAADLRLALVRLLEGARAPLALDALVRIATSGKTLFGGVKLAAAEPETLAAIRILARDWRSHPRAQHVLDRARKSRDEQLRSAAGAHA